MAQRQLERLEDQNRVFDSESLSSESEDVEESKKRSFDDSQGRSNTSGEADKTKANTTAKSGDSAIEVASVKALQESLDRFNNIQDQDGNRVRQELLQLANKAQSEKHAIAKQLDHLKDKQRAMKSKMANMEDKNSGLKQSLETAEQRNEK